MLFRYLDTWNFVAQFTVLLKWNGIFFHIIILPIFYIFNICDICNWDNRKLVFLFEFIISCYLLWNIPILFFIVLVFAVKNVQELILTWFNMDIHTIPNVYIFLYIFTAMHLYENAFIIYRLRWYIIYRLDDLNFYWYSWYFTVATIYFIFHRFGTLGNRKARIVMRYNREKCLLRILTYCPTIKLVLFYSRYNSI